MPDSSLAVQLARLDERMSSVLRELDESKTGRKTQYEAIEALGLSMAEVNRRVGNVENKLASAQPTIEEFITIKHKVQGAGAFGKWLWAVGGILLGIAAGSREAIFHWLSGPAAPHG